MRVKWVIGPGVRCDLVGYAGRNLNGKRSTAQFYPTGSQNGSIDGAELSSVVIRALPGTRIIFAASNKDTWESAAWRAIRMVKPWMRSAQRNGLPGIRVPDLDLVDTVDAKRSSTEFESSYPFVESLADGTGQTFGRGGGLKNRVAMIRIEREGPTERALTPAEDVARAILTRLQGQHPAAVTAAAEAARDALRAVGPDAVDALDAWLDG